MKSIKNTVLTVLFWAAVTSAFAAGQKIAPSEYPKITSSKTMEIVANDSVTVWIVNTVQVSVTQVILQYIQSSKSLLSYYKTAYGAPIILTNDIETASYTPVVTHVTTIQ